jgi:hypothetical protein
MERKILPYLIAISALSVSLSAAFYSVTGLSKMFAGASTQVLVMASSLEIAKLVIASLLYQYWDKLGALLKLYLTIAVGILMLITSGGIYGYLSSAYSETSTKLEVISKNVAVYDLKRERFQIQLNDVITEKQSLTESILELTKGISNNVIQYKDKDGNIITTTSSATRKALEKQLNDAKQQRDKLSIREEALTDSVTKIDLLKLEMETNTDVASEVGPLKYIANITGKSMDQVVNWFIIALMLVFDPLAIALVIAANVVFSKPKDDIPPKPKGGLNDRPDVKRAMEMASKLSEGHEIDEDEPTALAFTPYNIEYEYDDEEDEEEDDELTWDDLLKNNDWSDEEWNEAIMDDLEDEEWDEDDAMDQVLNHIVEQVEDDIDYKSPKNFIANLDKIKSLIGNIDEVKELIEYLDKHEGLKQYKTDIGYKMPISILDSIGFTKNKLDIIRVNTKPFEGRLIIEDDICIIEHPNIYNKND